MRFFRSLMIIFLIIFISLTGCKKGEDETSEKESTIGTVKSELVELNEGDVVFAQWFEGEGKVWEEAEVLSISGEDVTIEWSENFNKDEPSATLHYKKLIFREPIDMHSLEVGSKVLIQPEDKPKWAHYKGEIVGIEDGTYSVKYLLKDEEKTDDVDVDRLWNFL